MAVLAGVATLLTACGSIHPGSAAVVGGEAISMGTADEASAAYCKLSLVVARQQGVKDVSAADTRRQAITDLITYKVAMKIAKQRHLNIDPATYVVSDKQSAQIEKSFGNTDLGQIRDAIQRSQYTYEVTVALGQIDTGKTFSTATQAEIEKAGSAEIAASLKASDISIDPRFGLDDVAKQISQTGSLSVPVVAENSDPASRPVSQRCS